MPLSPASAEPGDALSSYLAGWEAVQTLVHRGQSWSGRERNTAYLNLGQGAMGAISAVSGIDFADDGRALAVTDWDRDGDLDLWLGNRTGPRLRLLRNQSETAPLPPRFLSLRLIGTTSNRDAIGARAQLQLSDGTQRMQIVTAGDGYLSQSSPILHFGLSKNLAPVNLKVRWPSGLTQTFHNLEPNRHYLVVEGRPNLDAESRPPTPPALPQQAESNAEGASPAATARSRILLSTPIPVPRLTYTREGEGQSAVNPSQPLLVNLWASWCAPCVVELRDLTRQANALRQANLQVLALSVDELDLQHKGSADQADRLLRQMRFPFLTGKADQVWLEKMEILLDMLFDRHLDLAVPTSFLIDTNQNLSVIYRGPVDLPTLRADLDLMGSDPKRRRQEAVPFSGRWYGPPGEPLLEMVAKEFQDRFPEEAEHYLKQVLPSTATSSRSEAEQMNLRLELVLALLRQGKVDEATEELRQLMTAHPDMAEAWIVFAEIARLRGRLDTAVLAYRKGLELKADLHHAADRLARLLATHPEESIRDGGEAIRLARQACQATEFRNPAYLDTLAAAYAEAGHFEQAVQTARQAIERARAIASDSLLPGIQARLRLYEERRPYRESSPAP